MLQMIQADKELTVQSTQAAIQEQAEDMLKLVVLVLMAQRRRPVAVQL